MRPPDDDPRLDVTQTLRNIGATARELRQRKGWTQLDLAAEARLNPNTVNRFERGGNTTIETLLRVADALGEVATSLIDGRLTDPGAANAGSTDLSSASDTSPSHLSERVLWTMRKDGRTAEARTRIVLVSNRRPELRIYVSHGSVVRIEDLLWSQVLVDGREVDVLAEQKKADFLKHGWVEYLGARPRGVSVNDEPSGPE